MTAKTRTAAAVTKDLGKVVAKLATKEGEVTTLRDQRNKLILEARTSTGAGCPVKLRDLAAITGLGTTFVGRIEHDKGKPESGSKSK